jgi:hypothetical protein
MVVTTPLSVSEELLKAGRSSGEQERDLSLINLANVFVLGVVTGGMTLRELVLPKC